MKKFFLLVLITVFTTLLISCGIFGDDVDSENALEIGLGRSVNIVEAEDFNNFIGAYSVLDTKKVDKLNVISTYKGETYFNEFSSTKISNLRSSTNVGFSFDLTDETSFAGMFVNVSMGFKSSTSTDYSSYSNQYFYIYEKFVLEYSKHFEDYLENDYSKMLSSNYLDSLEKLSSGEMSYFDFFDNYGSHIIVSANYGGRLDAYYSVLTNCSDINKSTEIKITESVEAGFTGVGTTEAKLSSDVTKTLNVSNSQIESNLSFSSVGGSTFTGSSINDFQACQTAWSDSFNSSENSNNNVLMDYAEDGLVPLWDMLPDQYSNLREEFVAKFEEYYYFATNEIFVDFEQTTDHFEYSSIENGKSDRTITDEGEYGMSTNLDNMDVLYMDQLMSYSNEDYVFKFEITMNIMEENDGYQEIWLYNKFNKTDVTSESVGSKGAASFGMVTGESQIEYGENYAGDYSLTWYVAGDDIRPHMYLKYDANGEGDDEWKLNHIIVKVSAIPVVKVCENNSESRKIDDDGNYGLGVDNTNNADVLDFSSFTDEFTDDYIYTIIIRISMRESNSGKQQFFLYNNINCTTDNDKSLDYAVKNGLITNDESFDFDAYKYDYKYGAYNVLDKISNYVYIVLQVSGENIADTVYLRYDASGEYEDDWYINDLEVFVFNEMKIDSE